MLLGHYATLNEEVFFLPICCMESQPAGIRSGLPWSSCTVLFDCVSNTTDDSKALALVMVDSIFMLVNYNNEELFNSAL